MGIKWFLPNLFINPAFSSPILRWGYFIFLPGGNYILGWTQHTQRLIRVLWSIIVLNLIMKMNTKKNRKVWIGPYFISHYCAYHQIISLQLPSKIHKLYFYWNTFSSNFVLKFVLIWNLSSCHANNISLQLKHYFISPVVSWKSVQAWVHLLIFLIFLIIFPFWINCKSFFPEPSRCQTDVLVGINFHTKSQPPLVGHKLVILNCFCVWSAMSCSHRYNWILAVVLDHPDWSQVIDSVTKFLVSPSTVS